MKTLIESLKRLYLNKRITKKDVAQRVENGTITAEEYKYITGEKYK